MEMVLSRTRFANSFDPAWRRATIFLTIVVFHAFILALFTLSRTNAQPDQKRGVLSVFAISASSSASVIPTPVPIIIPADMENSVSRAVTAESGLQNAEGSLKGESCSPLDEITTQLVSDPLVPLAIQRVARGDRSISEAIVMWNVEWSAASAEEAPLADVRNRVITILNSLPSECLTPLVTGPRLIAIPKEGYTSFLAFGSGEWSWQQVVETNSNVVPSETQPWMWSDFLRETDSSEVF